MVAPPPHGKGGKVFIFAVQQRLAGWAFVWRGRASLHSLTWALSAPLPGFLPPELDAHSFSLHWHICSSRDEEPGRTRRLLHDRSGFSASFAEKPAAIGMSRRVCLVPLVAAVGPWSASCGLAPEHHVCPCSLVQCCTPRGRKWGWASLRMFGGGGQEKKDIDMWAGLSPFSISLAPFTHDLQCAC